MKPRRSPVLRSTRGSTYITVLWISILCGVVLAAYLSLVGSQNQFSMRSQAWNRCIAVAEAGIEDALSHMNRNGLTNYTVYQDGWWFFDGTFHKRRYVDDALYEVIIKPERNPIVLSRAYVPVANAFAAYQGAGPFLAQATPGTGDEGEWWWGYWRSTFVYRTLRVETVINGMFTKGLVAKDTIDLSGNNIRTDSFDSEDPRYNSNGLYCASLAKDNGDVATVSGIMSRTNISAANANIFGCVSTGPRGNVELGPNGAVGDATWQNGGNKGIQPGKFRDDMNMQFFDVNPPFSSGYFTPSAGTVNGTNYDVVLGDGTYLSDKTVRYTGQETIYVDGDAKWWCQDGFVFSGQGSIIIGPNASLKIYVGDQTGTGDEISIGGNGVFNASGNAANCMIFGLPSCSKLDYQANANYVGTVYAPNANFSLGGGGANIYDFVGASVTKNVVMNGHFNFHYDEALGRLPPTRGYLVTSWNEVK